MHIQSHIFCISFHGPNNLIVSFYEFVLYYFADCINVHNFISLWLRLNILTSLLNEQPQKKFNVIFH